MSAARPAGAPSSQASHAGGASGRPAVFLDRDGVLNAPERDPETGEFESPLRAGDVRLLDGVPAALRSLREAGYALVCVTNQPAAAKGKVSIAELEEIQRRVEALLGAEGISLDDRRMCLHHPQGVVPELSGPCECRKPAPGMLLAAARDLGLELASSWMVGDTDTDVLAGRAAGCRTVLVQPPESAHKRSGEVEADVLAQDLADGVAQLLAA